MMELNVVGGLIATLALFTFALVIEVILRMNAQKRAKKKGLNDER